MDIRVVHVKDRGWRRVEYVGRPTVLGNPYRIGRDGDRAAVIEKYRRWLWGRMQGDTPQRRELERLLGLAKTGPLALACYCKPLACHGDVIKRALAYLEGGHE